MWFNPAIGIIRTLYITVANITLNDYAEIQDINNEISLKSLIDYCWKNGLPVIYLPKLPVLKQINSIIINVNGRPVINLIGEYENESDFIIFIFLFLKKTTIFKWWVNSKNY